MYGLDLFSGIGGLTRALEGYARPIAYCENDRYSQSVLLSRIADGDLPPAPIWDDVRTLRGIHLPLAPEIIYGGFPCQDISVAGRGGGLDAERSGLFFEVARLVGEIRPRFVFLENVSAITVRGAERIIAEFSRLRYDCRWGLLSASDVGANHRRERWWLLAHAMPTEQRGKQRKTQTQEYVVANTEKHDAWWMRIGRQATQSRSSLRSEILAHSWSYGGKRRGITSSGENQTKTSTDSFEGCSPSRTHWTIEPNVGRVAHGVPFRVDRLRGLGNAVVPAQAREAFERLMGIK